MNSDYHKSVLLHDCIDGLKIKPDGVYVDVTFGGGGHSLKILTHLNEKGKLYAFDQDADAQQNILDDSRFVLIRQNFRYLKNMLGMYGVQKVDGVLADLGVSSHQFNDPERGFSNRFDARLDMRMNQEAELDAVKVVNEYTVDDLYEILKNYGEIKRAYRVAEEIEKKREEASITTVNQLMEAIKRFAVRGKENKFYAQVFQAIRIEVNGELDALKELLDGAKDLLDSGGRLVVMSYHSLEDRLVKNFIKRGNFEGKQEQDFYGNVIRDFKEINRKIIIPTEEEIKNNSRARSAKLRIGEKI